MLQVVNFSWFYANEKEVLRRCRPLKHISATSEDRAATLEDARDMERRVTQWLNEDLARQATKLGGTLLVMRPPGILLGMVTCVGTQKADVYQRSATTPSP